MSFSVRGSGHIAIRKYGTGIIVETDLPGGNRTKFRPFAIASGDAEVIKNVYEHRHYDALHMREG